MLCSIQIIDQIRKLIIAFLYILFQLDMFSKIYNTSI